MTVYTTKTIVATITGTNGDFVAAFDSYNIGNDGEHLKTKFDIVLPTAWNVFIATTPASFISVEYKNAKGRCGRSADIAVPASIATHISYEIPRDALYSGETEFWFTVTQPIDATESRITKTAVVRCNVGLGHKAGTVPDPFGHDIIQQLVDVDEAMELAKLDKNFTTSTSETTLLATDIIPINKVAGTLKKSTLQTLSTWLADTTTHVFSTVSQNIRGAINELKAEIVNLNYTGSTHDALVTGALIDSNGVDYGVGGLGTFLDGRISAFESGIVVKPTGADDTEMIQSVFTNVIDGQTVKFTKGTYVITGTSILTCTKSINIECENGVVFDATGCTATGIFSFSGSYGTYYNIGADAVLGAITITVDAALASTLATGDLLFLSTATSRGGNNTLWTAARAYYYKGEITKVESVSGTTVTLAVPLYDDYLQFDVSDGTTPETMICKISPVTVSIKDVVLNCTKSRSQTGIFIFIGENCNIYNSRISGAGNTCVSIAYVYNFTVKNCKCEDYMASGAGYGIGITSSCNGIIADNYCVGGRHGVSHGGYEPCRNIVVRGNTCHTQSADTNAGIDVHHNAEFIIIDGNTASGIYTAGRNMKIINNTILQQGAVTVAGISFYVAKDCEYIIISGNTITTDAIAGTKNGIRVNHSDVDTITINRIIITNNVVRTVNNGIFIDATKEGLVVNSIDISNNEVYTIAATGIAFGESAAVVTTHAIAHNIRIFGNYANCPFSCVSLSSLYSATTDIAKICNNIFEVTTANYAPLTAKLIANLDVRGNYLSCVHANSGGYNLLNASNSAIIKDNTFVNLIKSGVGGTITKAIIADNIYQNTTIADEITGTVVSHIDSEGTETSP